MHPLILFVLKSMVVCGILVAWYVIALKNRRMHQYNRFFLLFTLYASIQVPLLDVHWSPAVGNPPAVFISATRVIHALDAAEDSNAISPKLATAPIDAQLIGFAMAALVSLVLLTTMAVRMMAVLRLNKRYGASTVSDVKLVQTDLPNAPFSFLSTIYWRDNIPLNTETGRMILRHEMVHIRQKHTFDRLACQLLTCIFWMNPFYWFIQKELAMVHEFLADEQGIRGDGAIPQEDYTAVFAKMLLRIHARSDNFAPEHQFFSSPTKRRLNMLQSNKRVRAALLRRMMVLPLLAGSVALFAFRPQGATLPAVNAASKEIVLVVDAGHGGNDGGCQSGKQTEKDLTLSVARRLEAVAPRYNIKVYLTRTSDKDLTLQERVAFSNNLHPDFFISLHIGSHPGAGSAQATFDIAVNSQNAKAEESKRLAYALLSTTARPEWVQEKAFSEKNPYVLRESRAASVLMELANINNREQLQNLEDDTKLDELCSHILEGVVEAHR